MQKRQRQISEIIIHPEFESFNKPNDIAIIVLQKDFEWTNLVRPITFPPQDAQIEVDKEGIISRWRVDENANSAIKLRQAKMRTIEEENCSKIYVTQHITSEMFCAGGNNVTFSFGDFGML